MKQGTGKLLWRLLCGLCKANTHGPDFNHVQVFETKKGALKVEFIISHGLLLRLDRDAQDAIVLLAAKSSIDEERDKLKLHIQTQGLGKLGKTWYTVASFADEVKASACYWHAYRELNNNDVRLIVEIDGQVKVLQSKGDTR